MSNNHIDISAIIPITETRIEDITLLHEKYSDALRECKKSFEIIFVFDGERANLWATALKLKENNDHIKLVLLSKSFGESVAINAGFESSSGKIIVTLPPYLQIDTNEIPKLISELEDFDMVVAMRSPRMDPNSNQLQARVFHKILNSLTELELHDIGCSVRALDRNVLEEVNLYGDLHRFLPHLAHRKGFKVKEVPLKQAQDDVHSRIHSPGIYIRRLLDLFSVFFLTKFTKKPLRFFGLIGSSTFAIGLLISMYLIFERIFFDMNLGDRPALVISSLFMVLGIQVLAIGLIGEIIIFTHAKDLKEYTIEKIV